MSHTTFTRRSFIRLASGFASVAGLGLMGCANSSTATGSTDGSSAAGGSAAASGDYELLTEGVLTVGTSVGYEPFEYLEDGEYKGFDLDLINLIADKLGLTVQLENVNFDALVPGVSSDAKFDCAIGAITITAERKKEVDFSDAYYMDDQAIVTMVDNTEVTSDNYADVLNAEGVIISVLSGSSSETFAEENYPNATIVPLNTAMDSFSALQAGQADALITNRSVAVQLTASSFDNEHVVGLESTGEEYGIAVSQSNPNLTAAINEALAELTEDGSIDALMNQYNV